MAAPVYQDAVLSVATSTTVSATHVDTSTAVTTGDLLLLICMSDSGNPGTDSYVFNTPTGYTQLGASSGNTEDVAVNVFWKIADSGDESGTSITVNHNAGTDDLMVWHVLVTGNHGSTPIYGAATTCQVSATVHYWLIVACRIQCLS